MDNTCQTCGRSDCQCPSIAELTQLRQQVEELKQQRNIQYDGIVQLNQQLSDLQRLRQEAETEWQDWERWSKEVLTDFKIPFDDHKAGIRYAITNWMIESKGFNGSVTLGYEQDLRNEIEDLQRLRQEDVAREAALRKERDGLNQLLKTFDKSVIDTRLERDQLKQQLSDYSTAESALIKELKEQAQQEMDAAKLREAALAAKVERMIPHLRHSSECFYLNKALPCNCGLHKLEAESPQASLDSFLRERDKVVVEARLLLTLIQPRLNELVRAYKNHISTGFTQDFDDAKRDFNKALDLLDLNHLSQ